MSEWRARLRRWRTAVQQRLPRRWNRALAGSLIVIGIVLPFLFSSSSAFMNATIIAIAYAVMSLGLNIVVGFAGLLDLGYVAFYALGAYSLGLAVPFVASALLLERFFDFFARIRGKLLVLSRASGALLVLVGVLMLTNQFTRLASRLQSFTPDVIRERI